MNKKDKTKTITIKKKMRVLKRRGGGAYKTGCGHDTDI